jgi:lipopolysaccharide export system protein LptA
MYLLKTLRTVSARLLLAALLLAGGLVRAQQFNPQLQQDTTGKKEVEILNADYLKLQEVGGKKVTRLVGNVALKQNAMYIWCDSANLEKGNNNIEAWGRVHIQNDTINAYGQYLKYDGETKLATLQKNAKLTDRKMVLYTNELFYNTADKVANYYTGGKVIRDSTVITSKIGYYYSNTDDVFFNKNVKINDPNYRLESDTLKYNIETKVSTFYGNTVIYNDDSRINCNNGWYNSSTDIASFGANTVVTNPPQVLYADSLYYERYKSEGYAYKHFTMVDSSKDMQISGKRGNYREKQEYLMATEHPVLIYKMDKDTLFLTADTLKSMNKSERDSIKEFFAYRKVRMFMKQMQGICDSLYYSFEDSTFRFFYKPVMWNDETQMSADSMILKTKSQKADEIQMYKSAFIISPSDSLSFDQMKGINIFGYFKDNELDRLFVEGNAESLYYGKDDAKNKMLGINKTLSATMWIYFKAKKISRILFIKKPEGVFTPIKMVTEEVKKLKDFNWQIEKKPKSSADITDEPTVK